MFTETAILKVVSKEDTVEDFDNRFRFTVVIQAQIQQINTRFHYTVAQYTGIGRKNEMEFDISNIVFFLFTQLVYHCKQIAYWKLE